MLREQAERKKECKTLLEKQELLKKIAPQGAPPLVFLSGTLFFLQNYIYIFIFFFTNCGATCIKDDLELLTRYFLIFHKKGGTLKLFMLESSLM